MRITLETDIPARLDAVDLDQFLESTVKAMEQATGKNWTVKLDGKIVRFASKPTLLRSKTALGSGGSVAYDAGPNGYRVYVLDAAGQILDEYSGGNSPSDSTAHDPNGVGYAQLLAYAERTAQDMAEENGIRPNRVHHDPDIMSEEREMAGQEAVALGHQ